MSIRKIAGMVALVTAAVLWDTPVNAGTQTILGKLLRVTNPASGNETVVGYGTELPGTLATVMGDPLSNGATVRIIANGTVDQDASFVLPAGASPPGGSGWTSISNGAGYLYEDPNLSNGPVKNCLIHKRPSGTFLVKCLLKGSILGLAPPGNGTDGGMIFTINGGGDTYCVSLGATAGGTVTNSPSGITFKIVNAIAEPGCPAPTPPPRCCDVLLGPVCANLPVVTAASDCTALPGGTLAAPGLVCDAPSGTCQVVDSGTANCCAFTVVSGQCAEGPISAAVCSAAAGTFFLGGSCELDGVCRHFCGDFLTKWGAFGSGDGQFTYPFGVAVDTSGNVDVADVSNHRIQKFTSSGTFLTKWGASGSGDGQFANPSGVAVDTSGNVYVADVSNRRIQKFTSSGTFLTKWGAFGSGDGQFDNAYGVAVDMSGNVYVADAGNARIQKFTSSGTFLTKWGAFGSGDGQFDRAFAVAVDTSGNVYVADAGNARIQKFTSSGTFLTKWGAFGSGDGQFANPSGVAVDTSGNVYVADFGFADFSNHRIQKFTSSGTFLTKWGASGSGDGQFDFPLGVAVDTSGNVYVADNGNRRIQKFECP
jgi:hypothetical protein